MTALAPLAAFVRVLRKMLLAVIAGLFVMGYLGRAVQFIRRRPTEGTGELLVTGCVRVVKQNRRLPSGHRLRDDFDLVLLLAELVRLQSVAWMACGLWPRRWSCRPRCSCTLDWPRPGVDRARSPAH